MVVVVVVIVAVVVVVVVIIMYTLSGSVPNWLQYLHAGGGCCCCTTDGCRMYNALLDCQKGSDRRSVRVEGESKGDGC